MNCVKKSQILGKGDRSGTRKVRHPKAIDQTQEK